MSFQTTKEFFFLFVLFALLSAATGDRERRRPLSHRRMMAAVSSSSGGAEAITVDGGGDNACPILDSLTPGEVSDLGGLMNSYEGQSSLCNLADIIADNEANNYVVSDCSSDSDLGCELTPASNSPAGGPCTFDYCYDNHGQLCTLANPFPFGNGTEYFGTCPDDCGYYGGCVYNVLNGVEINVDAEDQTMTVQLEAGRRKKGVELVKFLLMKKKAVRSWRKRETKRTGGKKNTKRCTETPEVPDWEKWICDAVTWTCNECIEEEGEYCEGACWSPEYDDACCMANWVESCE